MSEIHIYTDGACSGNPGPGGFAYIIDDGSSRIEHSKGYRLTTNNRMELLAIIEALNSFRDDKSLVIVYTDSQYIVNAINKRWIDKWQINGWQTANKKPVKNKDLWIVLIDHLYKKKIKFVWIRGHNGHTENERADELARSSLSKYTEIDEVYENTDKNTGFDF